VIYERLWCGAYSRTPLPTDEPQPQDCPAHGPLTDDGGCAGCVAEDRATEAWEGRR
jgi:hypothetical protein